jgi:hypothetical protein
MDVFGVDKVVVVEDEVELARRCGNLVEEDPRQGFDARGLGRAQRGQDDLPEPLIEGSQRGDEVRQEPDRVIVSSVQGEPGDRMSPGCPLFRPLADQRGLAEARRRRDERQPASRLRVQLLGQAGTRD